MTHSRVYAGVGQALYVSEDRGVSWTSIRQFTDFIASVLVSSRDGAVYVAPRNSSAVNGVNKSLDHGESWASYSFNYSHTNLICWNMQEVPANGTIFVGVEIADHPQPYHPPVFRSTDGGVTWQDVSSGGIPWHVMKFQVDPVNQNVYALTENAGLYRSSDNGTTWQLLSNYFSLDLAMDPLHPNHLFGGAHSAYSAGGVWASGDQGVTFAQVGLNGQIASGIALNASSTTMYVASYNSGVFLTSLTGPRLNVTSLTASAGDDVSIDCAGCAGLGPATLTINGQQVPVTLTSSAFVFTVPAALPIGQYASTIAIAGGTVSLPIIVPQTPTAMIAATSSVWFAQNAVYAPGEVISVFGKRLTAASDTWGASNVAPSVPWGTRLASSSVLVDGTPAPMAFAFTANADSRSQINLQLPVTLAAGQHSLQVQRFNPDGSLATTSTAMSFLVKSISPHYFGTAALPIYLQNVTQDPTGQTFVSKDKPMRAGDVITVYATGLGGTNPVVAAGSVPSSLAYVSTKMSVLLGPQPTGGTVTWGAEFLAAVLSPQFPGLYQLSFRVPAAATPNPDGTVYLFMVVNNVGSQVFMTYMAR
jgi:uncharacterized protein (TIGR03437 family)